MASFSSFERRVSGVLSGLPRTRALAKQMYQRFNFMLHGERAFTLALLNDATLATPSQMIGAQEPDARTAEFFGYFDASPWSPDGRYYAVNQAVDLQSRTEIVLYDFQRKSRRSVGVTRASTWQQGAMPRWLVHRGRPYLSFNAVRNDVLGTQFVSPEGESERFVGYPLQAMNHEHGKFYSINYRRLYRNGTEYGYGVSASNLPPGLTDDEDGIWCIDLDNDGDRLIVSFSQLRRSHPKHELMSAAQHEINHLSVAPGGEHFVFVHRFRGAAGQYSRLYLARHDGQHLRMLLDDDMVSHYTWLSPHVLLAWARTRSQGDRYYVLDIRSDDIRPFPAEEANAQGDGHPTFHVAHNWIATDSYPDRKRQQHLFLLNPPGTARVEIGRFLLPFKFSGADRVDLHPRWSPTGNALSIDSGCYGIRRNYIIDVSRLVRAV